MRGKLSGNGASSTIPGITPAGAGKTLYTVRQQFPIRDHPRRCGENHSSGRTRSARRGSPPQVRGKPGILWPLRCSRRITPAGAGKTAKALTNQTPCRDHPRRCGENLTVCRIITFRPGSPPQVRGKRLPSYDKRKRIRITPAGAGKTNPCDFCSGNHRDHPRRCGENRFISGLVSPRLGSPPQVRGKRRKSFASSGRSRITPAGAGKTPCLNTQASPCEDHPRRCGENQYGEQESDWDMGSPPQVRGKLPDDRQRTLVVQDHPRRCGENRN